MSNFGSQLLDLVERSVIVQGIVMLTLLAAIVFLAVTNQEIPDLITQLALLTFGFYFGSKVENVKNRTP